MQDGQTGHDAGGGETLGQRLRRARESQGLEVEAVAERLHTDVTRLKALEHDDFSPFPAAVFARGYVRGYARMFSLPEAELIALYEKQAAPPAVSLHPLPATPYDKKATLLTMAGRVFALALLAGAVFWLMPYTPWRDEHPALNGAPAALNEEAHSGEDIQSAPPPAGMADDAESPDADAFSSVSTRQDAAVSERPVSESAQNVSPAETSGDALVLRFNAESWVEVYDQRGKTLLYELAPGGATRRFEQPQLPLRVRLGNSPAVNIEYNGKVFDQSPHARNSVADFVFDRKIAAAMQSREDDAVSVTAE